LKVVNVNYGVSAASKVCRRSKLESVVGVFGNYFATCSSALGTFEQTKSIVNAESRISMGLGTREAGQVDLAIATNSGGE